MDSRDGRRWQPGHGGQVHRRRAPGTADMLARRRDAAHCGEPDDRHCAEAPGQGDEPEPEQVQLNATPGDGYTGRTAPIGATGSRPPLPGSQQRTGDDRAQDTDQAVRRGHGGTCAQRTQHLQVLAARAELAGDGLGGDGQPARPAIRANAVRAIPSGSIALCACASLSEATWNCARPSRSWPLIAVPPR